MKLGVVIPVYNRASLVGTALRSVLREGAAADLDVVVVDDGSTDGSASVVAELAARHPCIRLIRQPNTGVNAARTAGLAALRPETGLITFLDSDDLWPAGRLAPDIEVFRTAPATEVVYGTMRLVDQVDEEAMAPRPGCRELTIRTIHLGAGIYRRATFEAVGGFDFSLEMAEDTDFLLRLFERRPRHLVTDRVSLIYRQHDSNMTRDIAASRRWFMMAVHKAVLRRRRDPSLQMPDGIFDVTAMRDMRRL